MINDLLTEAGFILGKTFKECRFLKPPKASYCVYLDSCEVRGSDDMNSIKDHYYTVELYSTAPDPDAEKRIEDALDAYAIAYSKESRTWVQDESLYQVIYNFNFLEKIRR